MFDFLKKTYKITYSSISLDGTRPYNEDSIKILDTEKRKLFILADGLGGCGNGKLASRTAVDSAADTGENSQDSGGTLLKEIFEVSQKAVTDKKDNPEKGMATTMVALIIEGKTAQWAHVGDSRLYWFRKNKAGTHTKDQSVPQMLVNIGQIKESEIRHHPDRSTLLHTIGYPWDKNPCDVSEQIRLRRGDAFLLCSDGFWENIEDEEMEQILEKSSGAEDWLKEMTETVEKHAADTDMDNYSAICVYVE
ncbi:PP2C family protein-serine/threonine phosphatase [Blautia massiliensis (ex Liu et al. 2021)]|uniref:PP2C family protein-serine/threonine phosphatase n=1 Tax=Blautia massiliensis (ex Liu et al. 2021) TaxID=3062492 RepID=UPI003F8A22B6